MEQISVIIPAYNASGVIRRSINSVLGQTLPPSEIIVINDGSTDDTDRVLTTFGDKIKYFSQKNSGASEARNYGIKVAKGEWIAFLDADDEWLPSKLESQMKILTDNPQLVWCACNIEMVRSGTSQMTHTALEIEKWSSFHNYQVSYFAGSQAGLPFQTGGFLIRRAIFSEVGMFDPALEFAQDRDLWWRIAMKYPFIGYCPEVCHRYYVGTEGGLTKKSRNRSEALLVVCDNVQRARQCNSPVVKAIETYGRLLVFDYLVRNAGRKIILDAEAVRSAKEVFRFTWLEKALLPPLKAMPKWIAGKLANFFELETTWR